MAYIAKAKLNRTIFLNRLPFKGLSFGQAEAKSEGFQRDDRKSKLEL